MTEQTPPARQAPSPRDIAARVGAATPHAAPGPAPSAAPGRAHSATPGPAPSAAARPSAAVPAAVPRQVTGAQALILALEGLGTEGVFGLPGRATLPAYDPLLDSIRLRHVLVRHEQGAGHAATGYAQATGRVGVCMATSGPGATNLVTPIADAFLDSVPVVAITGQ